MNKYVRVVDENHLSIPNYFKIVFCRGESIRYEVPFFRWVWLTIIEIVVGEELLESLVTTSSLSGSPEDQDTKGEYGYPQQLYLHVPAGLINNLLMRHIIEVLYYKYYKHYHLLNPLDNPIPDDQSGTVNVTRIRFRLKKDLLYQLIAFRRVYLFSWIAINLTLDMFVYFFSNSIEWALVSALAIEAIRRLVRI